jgi:hypothetical protein
VEWNFGSPKSPLQLGNANSSESCCHDISGGFIGSDMRSVLLPDLSETPSDSRGAWRDWGCCESNIIASWTVHVNGKSPNPVLDFLRESGKYVKGCKTRARRVCHVGQGATAVGLGDGPGEYRCVLRPETRYWGQGVIKTKRVIDKGRWTCAPFA